MNWDAWPLYVIGIVVAVYLLSRLYVWLRDRPTED